MSTTKNPSKATKATWCSCAVKVSEALESQKQELVLSFRRGADGELHGMCIVETAGAMGVTRRTKHGALMVANFCPFCGVKYPERGA